MRRCGTWQGNDHYLRPAPCLATFGAATRLAAKRQQTLGLQRFIADWIWAWRWRRRLRRLLAQEAQGQARLGSARQEVKRGAELPLRVIVARNVARRGPCA
jgi:hypothetical protein